MVEIKITLTELENGSTKMDIYANDDGSSMNCAMLKALVLHAVQKVADDILKTTDSIQDFTNYS